MIAAQTGGVITVALPPIPQIPTACGLPASMPPLQIPGRPGSVTRVLERLHRLTLTGTERVTLEFTAMGHGQSIGRRTGETHWSGGEEQFKTFQCRKTMTAMAKPT